MQVWVEKVCRCGWRRGRGVGGEGVQVWVEKGCRCGWRRGRDMVRGVGGGVGGEGVEVWVEVWVEKG